MAYLEHLSVYERSRREAGSIDLATFDEKEAYMYDPHGVNYFKAIHEKKKWFTQVPVQLPQVNRAPPAFGSSFSVHITRAGDYLLHTWLRIEIPAVSLLPGNENKQLRWTRNLAHALIKECSFTANDVVVARFDNYNLDFWSAFMTPEEKRNGYANMIGDVPDMTAGAGSLPSYTLNLPLQFFWSRDVTRALPTAILPYNELRINFSLRDWSDLLILDDLSAEPKSNPSSVPIIGTHISSHPSLGLTQVWANYAVVSGGERCDMARKGRTTIIECAESAIGVTSMSTHTGTRTATRYSYNNIFNQPVNFTLATKCLFFGVRNKTHQNQWSNYSIASPVPCKGGTKIPHGTPDPIGDSSLLYGGGNIRLDCQPAEYHSHIAPWYHAERIPEGIGYHMYSYALSLSDVNPTGSTNLSRIHSVSLMWTPPDSLFTAMQGTGGEKSGTDYPQMYESVLTGIGHKYIKYSGGEIKLEIE